MIKIGIIGCVLIFMANIALAQSKDLGFILGVGIVSHSFSEVDAGYSKNATGNADSLQEHCHGNRVTLRIHRQCLLSTGRHNLLPSLPKTAY